MSHYCCPICGKLVFPSDDNAGGFSWWECLNPKCPTYHGKWKEDQLKKRVKNEYNLKK